MGLKPPNVGNPGFEDSCTKAKRMLLLGQRVAQLEKNSCDCCLKSGYLLLA